MCVVGGMGLAGYSWSSRVGVLRNIQLHDLQPSHGDFNPDVAKSIGAIGRKAEQQQQQQQQPQRTVYGCIPQGGDRCREHASQASDGHQRQDGTTEEVVFALAGIRPSDGGRTRRWTKGLNLFCCPCHPLQRYLTGCGASFSTADYTDSRAGGTNCDWLQPLSERQEKRREGKGTARKMRIHDGAGSGCSSAN